MDKMQLAQQLSQTSSTLRDKYGELGEMYKALVDQKVASFQNADQSSVSGVRLVIEVDEAEIRKDTIDLETDIKILEEYRDHLRYINKYNLESYEPLSAVPNVIG